MKISVLDAATLGEDLDLSPLDTQGQVIRWENTAPEEVPAHIGDADVAVINKVRLGEKELATCPNIRLICIAATGYDPVDTVWCKAHGVGLCNVPGYSTESVAEVTLAMALSLTTRLKTYRDWVSSGNYTACGVANRVSPPFHIMKGSTWGVIGCGHIGSRVAEMARVMGCEVIGYARHEVPGIRRTDLDTLCRTADIISLHLPLTDETRGILSAERIGMMKPGTIVINVARGAVTDEKALAEAILDGRLGGLGVDVYSREPFGADHPFSRLRETDNVCLTPHMAWASVEARELCLREIVENIRSFREGGNRCRVV